jgi:hypothetical protein
MEKLMLRYILHVITAVLAFMIGLGWVQLVKLSGAPAETKTVIAPPMIAVSPTVTPTPTPSSAPKLEQKVKYVCRNRLFTFALDHLRKIDNEYIGRNYVDEFIDGAGIVNCTELFQVEKKIDLNGDGREEIILRAQGSPKGSFFCGATGNCETWVIRRERNGYKVILDASSIEEVHIQQEKTRRYSDLITSHDGGISHHTLAHYKYRDGKYTLKKCTVETVDTDGKKHIVMKKLSDCG